MKEETKMDELVKELSRGIPTIPSKVEKATPEEKKEAYLKARLRNINYGVFKDGENDYDKIVKAYTKGLWSYDIDFAYGVKSDDVTEYLNKTPLKGLFEVKAKTSFMKNEPRHVIIFTNEKQTELILNAL